MNDLKKYIPNIIISLGLIGLLLAVIDPRQTMDAIRHANRTALILAAILGFLWLLVRMMVWNTLLGGNVSKQDTFFTMMEGYLLNNTLPFRMGEFGRAFFLSQKTSLGFLQVFSTIIIERAGDLGFSALILILSLPFLEGLNIGYQVGMLALIGIIIFFWFLYWIALNPDKMLRIVKKIFSPIPKVEILIEKAAGKILPGLSVLRDPSAFLRFILWMTLNWGIAIVQYWLLVKAYFPEAKLIWGMFTLGVAAFGGAIPSLPGGVGTLEGAMTGAIAFFTNDISGALAVPLTLRLINYFYSGVFGFYALSKENTSLTGVYQQLKSKIASLRN